MRWVEEKESITGCYVVNTKQLVSCLVSVLDDAELIETKHRLASSCPFVSRSTSYSNVPFTLRKQQLMSSSVSFDKMLLHLKTNKPFWFGQHNFCSPFYFADIQTKSKLSLNKLSTGYFEAFFLIIPCVVITLANLFFNTVNQSKKETDGKVIQIYFIQLPLTQPDTKRVIGIQLYT